MPFSTVSLETQQSFCRQSSLIKFAKSLLAVEIQSICSSQAGLLYFAIQFYITLCIRVFLLGHSVDRFKLQCNSFS